MRSVRLHEALTRYVEEAAVLLAAEVAAGAEVPFEIEPRLRRRGAASALYCYRALTGEFIAARMGALERLPAHGAAAAALAGFAGLDRYLAATAGGARRPSERARASRALAALLEDVFSEVGDFELRPERLAAALERLERAEVADGGALTVAATLHGVEIASSELQLAAGLSIVRPEAIEGLPEGVLAPGEDAGAHLVVLLSCGPEEDTDLERARAVLLELLRALRLFGDGRVTLGALAWAGTGGGAWSPLALGAGGRPQGVLLVTPEQEDELRAFCNLVSRRVPHGDEVAWALRRFELGCARESAFEALSDYLLALRALLEPEGPASGLLAGRLAALCATPGRRAKLTERTLRALELERSIVAGTAVERAGSRALVAEVADNLRALLRDVICGHLAPGLAELADEILLAPEPASGEQHAGEAREAEEVLDLIV